MSGRSRTLARRSLPVVLLAISLGLVVPGPRATADERLRFADGTWFGALVGNGTVVYDREGAHAAFTSAWDGSFALDASEGLITGDRWQLSGTGVSTVNAGGNSNSGNATFEWGGQVTGETTAPTLEGVAHMHMRVVGVSIDATIPRSQTGNPQLQIYTASCSQVTGDWTAGIGSGIEANGGHPNISGTFAAYNSTGSLIEPEVFVTFFNEVEDFRQRAFAGQFLRADLLALIDEAESLEGLVRDIPSCALGDVSGSFVLMVYAALRNVIDYAVLHPERFSGGALLTLTLAGVRVGVLGSGAPDQEYAVRVESQLHDIFNDILEHAIADENVSAVEKIMELSIEMAWTDLVVKAGQYLP